MINLFSEIVIKNKIIKNRIVMPPMVCFGWTDNDGFMTEEHLEHYGKRAEGGIGTIIVEATCVNKEGRLANTQLGIWSDEHIEGLKALVDRCKVHNATVLIQIHHAGLKTPEDVRKPALAPCDYSDEKSNAVALTIEEIHNIQKDFLNAAIRAKKAGFDGVELHGAHGYLIDQFASPVTNKREDEYGGNLENRIKFAYEIVRSIKAEIGEDFILGYRMGGNAPTLEEGIRIAQILEEAGVDLLHVSAGITNGDLPKVPEDFKYNWIVYLGTEIKKHVSVPVIVVNGIRTPEQAAYIVKNNLADFTAIGKGILVDAQWSMKASEGDKIKPCLGCKRCAWFRDGKFCPQNKQ